MERYYGKECRYVRELIHLEDLSLCAVMLKCNFECLKEFQHDMVFNICARSCRNTYVIFICNCHILIYYLIFIQV